MLSVVFVQLYAARMNHDSCWLFIYGRVPVPVRQPFAKLCDALLSLWGYLFSCAVRARGCAGAVGGPIHLCPSLRPSRDVGCQPLGQTQRLHNTDQRSGPIGVLPGQPQIGSFGGESGRYLAQELLRDGQRPVGRPLCWCFGQAVLASWRTGFPSVAFRLVRLGCMSKLCRRVWKREALRADLRSDLAAEVGGWMCPRLPAPARAPAPLPPTLLCVPLQYIIPFSCPFPRHPSRSPDASAPRSLASKFVTHCQHKGSPTYLETKSGEVKEGILKR